MIDGKKQSYDRRFSSLLRFWESSRQPPWAKRIRFRLTSFVAVHAKHCAPSAHLDAYHEVKAHIERLRGFLPTSAQRAVALDYAPGRSWTSATAVANARADPVLAGRMRADHKTKTVCRITSKER
ncbi:hypothetical protein RAH42_12880 [Pyramidobacter sp. YE332]|uniref:hypothetical protein n=1 Tax=Pyramidobacter sp. YE332 TaxID=3068894 RepID=UPI00294AB6E0|nr:hypothetical protein [Pyramidobacter sp. YE332]WOL40012.1 hypothetical protein RAH42_12880 [Pyramidobacter sp. YE332]